MRHARGNAQRLASSQHNGMAIHAHDGPACQHVEQLLCAMVEVPGLRRSDRKSTRLNSSHLGISYAVFCLKKKEPTHLTTRRLPRAAIPLSGGWMGRS